MAPKEDLYGYADPESVEFAIRALLQTYSPHERRGIVSDNPQYLLLSYLEQIQSSRGYAVPLPSATPVLNTVVAGLEKQARALDPTVLKKGIFSAASFILCILDELREIICGKRKKPTKLGKETHAILAALGAAIAKRFHYDDATTVALAVLVLITLGQATKNAFCKMTDKEVLDALRR